MSKSSQFFSGFRLRLIAAIAAGGLSAFLIDRDLTKSRNAILGLPRSQILVAKSSVLEGARVEAKDLDVLDVPEVFKHPGAVPSSEVSRVTGRKLRTLLKPGQPLLWQDFMVSSTDRSGRDLGKGMCGVAVLIDEAMARSGMLNPRDHVNVLVTFTRSPDLKGSLTGTLFQNVKVLELRGTTALLELRLEDVELVTFVSKQAQVTLVLRNADDPLSPVPTKNLDTVIRRLMDEEDLAAGRNRSTDLGRYLNAPKAPATK